MINPDFLFKSFNAQKYHHITSEETGKRWPLHQVVHLLSKLSPRSIVTLHELNEYLNSNKERADLDKQATFVKNLITKQFRNPLIEFAREMGNNSYDAHSRLQLTGLPIIVEEIDEEHAQRDSGGGVKDLVTFFVPGRSSNPSAIFKLEQGIPNVTGRFGQGVYSYFAPLIDSSVPDAYYFIPTADDLILVVHLLRDGKPLKVECSTKYPIPRVYDDARPLRYLSLLTQGNGETIKIRCYPAGNGEVFIDMAVRREVKANLEGTKTKIRSPHVRKKSKELGTILSETFAFAREPLVHLNNKLLNDVSQVIKFKLASLDGCDISLLHTPWTSVKAQGTLMICEAGRTITSWPITGVTVFEKVAIDFPKIELSQERQKIDFKKEPYNTILCNAVKTILTSRQFLPVHIAIMLDSLLPIIEESDLLDEVRMQISEHGTNQGKIFLPSIPELSKSGIKNFGSEDMPLAPIYINKKYFNKFPLSGKSSGTQSVHFIPSAEKSHFLAFSFCNQTHIFVPETYVPSLNDKYIERFQVELLKTWSKAALPTSLNESLVKSALWPYEEQKNPPDPYEGKDNAGNWLQFDEFAAFIEQYGLPAEKQAFILGTLNTDNYPELGVFERDLERLCNWFQNHEIPEESQDVFKELIQRLTFNGGYIDLDRNSFPNAKVYRVHYPSMLVDPTSILLDYCLELPAHMRPYFVLHVKYYLCYWALSLCRENHGLKVPESENKADSDMESEEGNCSSTSVQHQTAFLTLITDLFTKMQRFVNQFDIDDSQVLKCFFGVASSRFYAECDELAELLSKFEDKKLKTKALLLFVYLTFLSRYSEFTAVKLKQLFELLPDGIQEEMLQRVGKLAHPCPEVAIIQGFLLVCGEDCVDKVSSNLTLFENAIAQIELGIPPAHDGINIRQEIIDLSDFAEKRKGGASITFEFVNTVVSHIASLEIPLANKKRWVNAHYQLWRVARSFFNLTTESLLQAKNLQGLYQFIDYCEKHGIANDKFFDELETSLQDLFASLRSERGINELLTVNNRFANSNSPYRPSLIGIFEFLEHFDCLFYSPWSIGKDPVGAIELAALAKYHPLTHERPYLEKWMEKLEAEKLFTDSLRSFFYAAILGTPIVLHIDDLPSITSTELQSKSQPLYKEADVAKEIDNEELARIRLHAATKQSTDPFYWITEAVVNAIEAEASLITCDAYLEGSDTFVLKISDNGHGFTPEREEALKKPGVTSKTTGENFGWGFYSLLGYWPEVHVKSKADNYPAVQMLFTNRQDELWFARAEDPARTSTGSDLILRKTMQNPRTELVKMFRHFEMVFRNYPDNVVIRFQNQLINQPSAVTSLATCTLPYRTGSMEVSVVEQVGGIFCKGVKMPDPPFNLLALVPEPVKLLLDKKGANVRLMLPVKNQLMNRGHLAEEAKDRELFQRAVLLVALRYYQQELFANSEELKNLFDTNFLFDFRHFQPQFARKDLGQIVGLLCSGDIANATFHPQKKQVVENFFQYFQSEQAQGHALQFRLDTPSSEVIREMRKIYQLEIGNESLDLNNLLQVCLTNDRDLKYILLELPTKSGKTFMQLREAFRKQLIQADILEPKNSNFNFPAICRRELSELEKKIDDAAASLGIEFSQEEFIPYLEMVRSSMHERMALIRSQYELVTLKPDQQSAGARWLHDFLTFIMKDVLKAEGDIVYVCQVNNAIAYVMPGLSNTISVNLASVPYTKYEKWYTKITTAQTREEFLSTLLQCEPIVAFIDTLAHELTHLELHQPCYENVHDELFRKTLARKLSLLLEDRNKQQIFAKIMSLSQVAYHGE